MTLQQLLGIDLPLLQAPMAGVQGSALAVAVCEAGGLGALPCAMLSPDAIRAEVAAIRAGTGRPFNLNFFCHQPPTPDDAREAAWRASLAPYYRELGLDPAAIPAAPGRAPFSAALAELVEALRPPVVSFHFGLPAPELLARVKASGARVLSSATTVDEALWLEARGVDAVIAQGLEAGGHRGMFLTGDVTTQLGTLALVPQIVAAVKLPVRALVFRSRLAKPFAAPEDPVSANRSTKDSVVSASNQCPSVTQRFTVNRPTGSPRASSEIASRCDGAVRVQWACPSRSRRRRPLAVACQNRCRCPCSRSPSRWAW